MSVTDPSASTKRNVVRKLKQAWGESPFYQASLRGPAPDRLAFKPSDKRTPDPSLGEAIVRGRIAVADEVLDCEGEPDRLWDLAAPKPALHAYLNEFSWLRHLSALGDEGRDTARALTKSWLERYERWSIDTWTPFTTAERLTYLCCYSDLVIKGGDTLWRSRVLASMARQTRHLAKVAERAGTGYERLMTAFGLTIAALSLPGCDAPATRGLELLRREMRLQLRPDGGHVSRNASHQLALVMRLRMVEDALCARNHPEPGFIAHALGRAVSFLDLFRCGDGGLAVFNGSYEDDRRALVAALNASAPADSPPTGFARYSGYQRLESGRVAMIADVGVTRDGQSNERRDGDGDKRFQGVGSFHLSSGRSRIVVNCGSAAHLTSAWASAMRGAGAHSVVSGRSDLSEARILASPTSSSKRYENAEGQLLEIERLDAFEGRRFRHLRRFFLASAGGDLRGQDRLQGCSPHFLTDAVLRFHLHPSVKASRARDGCSILLAIENGESWRFRSNCSELMLDRSVYCGRGGQPVATEQIVVPLTSLDFATADDITLKWAFVRSKT